MTASNPPHGPGLHPHIGPIPAHPDGDGLSEEHKALIEECARLLGWHSLKWRQPTMLTHESLLGFPPDRPSKGPPLEFPPSWNDGNGMLWLMGEIKKQDVIIDLDDDNEEPRDELTITLHSSNYYLLSMSKAKAIEDLPMAVTHAAVEALRAKG